MNLQIDLGFLRPIKEVLLTVSPLLVNLLSALVLLLVGLLIARGLQWSVIKIFEALQLDKGSKRIGFSELLTKGGLKKGATELLGDLIYWLTIFVTVTTAANLLGLVSAKELLGSLLAYLPAVLSAVYILGIGVFVAIFIAAIVLVILNNIGLSNAGTLAKIVQYTIIIFAFLAALGQLGVSAGWIISSMQLVVGAVALTFAIAFGLGAKDKAAELLDKLFG
ncbi:hypothetical protein HZB07_07310 [Candidatus Saganbacteria bacterium]|nr:hypothetical protein [Candidatus Saganbacteria bacterium]